MKKWHYITESGEFGPVTDYELRDLHEAKKINWDTSIWSEGMASWEPLSFHRNLVSRHTFFVDKSEQKLSAKSVEKKPEPNQLSTKLLQEKNNDSSNGMDSTVLGGSSVSVVRGWIIIFAVLSALAMLLFPPFQVTHQGTISNMGYGFLFSPPMIRGLTATVAVQVLLVQMIPLCQPSCPVGDFA
ncbi:DUF4339 domain-containing protein [Marinobacter sp. S6332]|uniref:DUF4339 domain-containing protein n=1 Tax=Marinobacter sp. S6332 TaxID=2926403 RepID=UPI001FF6504B|nr:DUF4339 domain-containing protein [Marinobacter sp. S6332]MCK0165893.1 DUF4339 domain-containing protein [Marinobacter sp. S6332]